MLCYVDLLVSPTAAAGGVRARAAASVDAVIRGGSTQTQFHNLTKAKLSGFSGARRSGCQFHSKPDLGENPACYPVFILMSHK